MTQNLLTGSPAVPLLLAIHGRGCRLIVTAAGDRLRVAPASRLTAEEQHRIRTHRSALATLVRDAGLRARVAVFTQQRRQAPSGTMPAFVFRPGTPYTKGRCFSCSAALPSPEFGRCGRCSLAWRLAAGVRVPDKHVAAYYGARVVA